MKYLWIICGYKLRINYEYFVNISAIIIVDISRIICEYQKFTQVNFRAGHGLASDRTIKAPTKIFKNRPDIKAEQQARLQTEHKSP